MTCCSGDRKLSDPTTWLDPRGHRTLNISQTYYRVKEDSKIRGQPIIRGCF